LKSSEGGGRFDNIPLISPLLNKLFGDGNDPQPADNKTMPALMSEEAPTNNMTSTGNDKEKTISGGGTFAKLYQKLVEEFEGDDEEDE
jgi:hypothetical protein